MLYHILTIFLLLTTTIAAPHKHGHRSAVVNLLGKRDATAYTSYYQHDGYCIFSDVDGNAGASLGYKVVNSLDECVAQCVSHSCSAFTYTDDRCWMTTSRSSPRNFSYRPGTTAGLVGSCGDYIQEKGSDNSAVPAHTTAISTSPESTTHATTTSTKTTTDTTDPAGNTSSSSSQPSAASMATKSSSSHAPAATPTETFDSAGFCIRKDSVWRLIRGV